MKFDHFERVASEAFDAIPPAYRHGIDGLVVSRETRPHPELPDIFTLGECDTEAYPSDWSGPETTRSVVVLYYGSFRALARVDPEFDWEAEIYETVEHEVRHHLEWLAGEDQLGDVDYAADENFKRDQGQDFDPWYWQRGEVVERGVYAVEDHAFIEQEWSEPDFRARDELEFEWRGERWRVPRPEELGDLHFVWLEEVENAPPALELVLVRRRSWWEDVKRLVAGSRPRVLESSARARRAGEA